jgi:Tfp pilus assembly protein PilZ
MYLYDLGRSKRAGLRIPVDFDVRCELMSYPTVMGRAVNMSTGGIFITTAEPIGAQVKMKLEFLMPETLNSIQVHAESVWSRPLEAQTQLSQGTGIKFVGLAEPYLRLIRDYSLSRLYDEDFIRSEGIVQILSDIRNLPPLYRLRAYHILIRKESKLKLPS